MKRIAAVLTLPRYALYDPSRGGGLWVGSRYPVTGDSLPDPQHGLLHAATATQVCRFYHMLAAGRLVSEDASFAMLNALSEPALQTKFVLALERRDPNAKSRIYRKSGTWGRYHADPDPGRR